MDSEKRIPLHRLNDPIEPDPVIDAFAKDVDVTLLRENLKLTVQQRFEKLLATLRFMDELRRAGRAAKQHQ